MRAHEFTNLHNIGVEEARDKYGYHTSVSKGKFLPSKYGQDENNLYLHDLMNSNHSGEGPVIVTINDKRIATEIASMYGGYVERTGLGTYRIYKPRGELQSTKSPELQTVNEFAPGNGDDGLPYAEYVVYQCDPKDQFEFISGPLYQSDNLGMAHKYAYEMFLKHRPKAFVVYQPHKEASRGNYGVKGESDEELNEFAVDGFNDGDNRSKLLGTVGRLLSAGNKVDWQVPGQMGHVIQVKPDGITMKKWKQPYSRMSFFLPMYDDSRDHQYTIKMVAPKHYAVVSAEKMSGQNK